MQCSSVHLRFSLTIHNFALNDLNIQLSSVHMMPNLPHAQVLTPQCPHVLIVLTPHLNLHVLNFELAKFAKIFCVVWDHPLGTTSALGWGGGPQKHQRVREVV